MGFNAKLFEIILYPESYNLTDLDETLSNGQIKDYAYILHDQDDKKPHLHIMIRCTDTRNSEHVAKWFGVNENQIGRVKGRFTDALRYLTHKNAPGKYQYIPENVHSNYDWQKEADKKNLTESEYSIYEKISTGEIREYNQHRYFDYKFYINNRTKIRAAFEYRDLQLSTGDRKMDTFYITGPSGVGKTTYAKHIATIKGYSYYVSSSSNDIMDGYKGQDCLILDDLRPSSISYSDLLKLLDPYTGSLVKSRYKNKSLAECKLVIITTTIGLDQFYNELFKKGILVKEF